VTRQPSRWETRHSTRRAAALAGAHQGKGWSQFQKAYFTELLRVAQGRNAQPSAAILDSRPLQSTPESGTRAGYDGAKRRRGSKVHMAVDTLGHLLTLRVTAASEQGRSQVGASAAKVQEVIGDSVAITFVDQGYTGDQAAHDAETHHRQLEVVKLPEAKQGFVLLPKRWVVERSNTRSRGGAGDEVGTTAGIFFPPAVTEL
jgi:transposase